MLSYSMGDDTASEGGARESEEETDSKNPYPLEGKFVNEADRAE